MFSLSPVGKGTSQAGKIIFKRIKEIKWKDFENES